MGKDLRIGMLLGLGLGLLLGSMAGVAASDQVGPGSIARTAPAILQEDAKPGEHSAVMDFLVKVSLPDYVVE
jgi:hypothetical protein